MWQVAQKSISTVTLLSEHKLPAIASISQRTVPREHIDTSLVQLMSILLDTGYLSFFENYALKIPVREYITLKHSEPLNTLPPGK